MPDERIRKIIDAKVNGIEMEISEEDKKYLRRRIRPIMQQLIDQEMLSALRIVSDYQYYGEPEMESFLQYAKRKERKLALLWLLNEKRTKFGFKDRTFEF